MVSSVNAAMEALMAVRFSRPPWSASPRVGSSLSPWSSRSPWLSWSPWSPWLSWSPWSSWSSRLPLSPLSPFSPWPPRLSWSSWSPCSSWSSWSPLPEPDGPRSSFCWPPPWEPPCPRLPPFPAASAVEDTSTRVSATTMATHHLLRCLNMSYPPSRLGLRGFFPLLCTFAPVLTKSGVGCPGINAPTQTFPCAHPVPRVCWAMGRVAAHKPREGV